MKTRIICVITAVLIISTALIAEEIKEKTTETTVTAPEKVMKYENTDPRVNAPKDKYPTSHKGEKQDRFSSGSPQRRQLSMLENRLDVTTKEHEALMGKLMVIKKQAEQEKAVKTAKLVQDLIDKKNEAFAEEVKKLRANRDRIKEREKDKSRIGRPFERKGPSKEATVDAEAKKTRGRIPSKYSEEKPKSEEEPKE